MPTASAPGTDPHHWPLTERGATTLDRTLGEELSYASTQLASARAAVAIKDTPAGRAAVAARQATVDGLLDMLLDTHHPGAVR